MSSDVTSQPVPCVSITSGGETQQQLTSQRGQSPLSRNHVSKLLSCAVSNQHRARHQLENVISQCMPKRHLSCAALHRNRKPNHSTQHQNGASFISIHTRQIRNTGYRPPRGQTMVRLTASTASSSSFLTTMRPTIATKSTLTRLRNTRVASSTFYTPVLAGAPHAPHLHHPLEPPACTAHVHC